MDKFEDEFDFTFADDIAFDSNTITIDMNTLTGAIGSIDSYTDYTWATGTISGSLSPKTLDVKGDATFDGEVTIKGKKLSEVLENIESRLAILHPNVELEEKWENLRGLRQAYVELEREIIEKEKMWAILKR